MQFVRGQAEGRDVLLGQRSAVEHVAHFARERQVRSDVRMSRGDPVHGQRPPGFPQQSDFFVYFAKENLPRAFSRLGTAPRQQPLPAVGRLDQQDTPQLVSHESGCAQPDSVP